MAILISLENSRSSQDLVNLINIQNQRLHFFLRNAQFFVMQVLALLNTLQILNRLVNEVCDVINFAQNFPIIALLNKASQLLKNHVDLANLVAIVI